MSNISKVKIAIVGVGNVGATFAYALMQSSIASEIVLIDANRTKAEGEAMDLNHAMSFSPPVRIWAGEFEDCKGAAIIVVTAGANQKPGETRLDLVQKNTAIFQTIIPQITANNTDGILLIATNPVDILSYVSWKVSGLPSHQVFGSGTILDTARFRFLISQHAEVDPRSVHAFIIGEHGDSEVPVWSLANIAGMRLEDYCRANCSNFDPEVWKKIFQGDERRSLPDHSTQRRHVLRCCQWVASHLRSHIEGPEYRSIHLNSGKSWGETWGSLPKHSKCHREKGYYSHIET